MAANYTVKTTGKGFQGVTTIYEYVNEDSKVGNMCGQAACATLLTYLGYKPAMPETLAQIVKSYPSDMPGGNGSTPFRIREILEGHLARDHAYAGNDTELKNHVRLMQPMICVIQNTPGLLNMRDGSHWFVVFAYNDAGVFVTNYDNNFLTWSAFNGKWNSYIPTVAGAVFKAITNTARIPNPKAGAAVA